MYLGNTPVDETVIRVEARKSFALGLWLQDSTGVALDITGATIRIVAKRRSDLDEPDATNIIANDVASLVDPTVGYACFYLQASDLDQEAGEYELAIVMLHDGYSSVLAKGVLDLLPNSESDSAGQSYAGSNTPDALTIAMSGPKVLYVRTGPILPPGTTNFTLADKSKLDSIEAGAEANPPNELPGGGSKNAMLVKNSDADGDVKWVAQGSGSGGSGLDATGITAGYSPIADGTDGWDWGPAVPDEISADIVVDGTVNKAYTATEQTKLAGLTRDYNELDNLPELGSASEANVGDFLPSTGIDGDKIISGTVAAARLPRIGSIQGNTYGTAAPTGGSDGDEYFQYTP